MKKIDLSGCVTAGLTAALGMGLLVDSGAVAEGVRDGLQICAGLLIPALFPFMVLSAFLSFTEASKILSIPLAPITTRLFRLPGELGAVVLLSMVGGYPVGAKSVSMLLSQGKISKETAQRMLCFCVNSGPSFLITAVGAGMMVCKTAGIILFFSQTAATILIGALVSRGVTPPKVTAAKGGLGTAAAFVAAVTGASSAVITMCSFAVLFSGLLSLVSAGGAAEAAARIFGLDSEIVSAVISGFFEVASGCVKAASLGGDAGFALISAFASFGGLSVLFQIMSCFRENPVDFRGMILARICHIPLSLAIAMPMYRMIFKAQSVFAPAAGTVMRTDGRTAVITVCLLCMCALTVLSEPREIFKGGGVANKPKTR